MSNNLKTILLTTFSPAIMVIVIGLSNAPIAFAQATCVDCCTTISVGGCAPSCNAPFCGQDNGCGASCPNTDAGAPAKVTNIQPSGTHEFACTNTTNRVIFSWDDASSSTDRYQVRVFTTGLGSPGNINCSSPQATCTTTTGTTYTYIPTQAIGREITIAIQAVNNSCNPAGEFSEWQTANITLTGELCGSFYLDNASTCSGTANGPITPNPGSKVTVTYTDGSTYNTSVTGQNYSVAGVPYSPPGWAANVLAEVNLENNLADPANYLQLASCNNSQLAGLTSPDNEINWYVQQYDLSHGPWWQSRGGLVFGKSGILSEIPANTCQADPLGQCIEYLVTKDNNNSPKSGGIALSEGNIEASGFYSDRRPESDQPHVAGNGHSHARITQENYSYFTKNLDLTAVEQISSSTISTLPTGTLLEDAYLSYKPGSLTLDVSTPITIPSGDKRIVFINGDLTIQGSADPIISVAEGGFLAFIVSGNILISPEIGHTNLNAPTTDANLEGIYVADGTVTIQSKNSSAEGDRKIIIAGTIVGWSGVELQRDFAYSDNILSNAENNTRPTETFVYRPDLLLNTPDLLKTSSFVWQEVN